MDEDTTAYDGGHIPGAVKLDWKRDLQDPVRRDFVNKEQFEALLSARGIGNDDRSSCTAATTTGSPRTPTGTSSCTATATVKLLDGGRKKWELDDRPLGSETVTRARDQLHRAGARTSIRAFRDEVVAAIGSKNLVDVRSPDEYAGRLLAPAHLPQEQAQRGGHIPTALSVPWSKAANEDGTFKSDDELRELYGDAGLDGGKRHIAYCRIGERSSHTWFVLHELLGQPT